MTSIKLVVNGAQARAEVDGILTSGAVGIPVTIQYDSAWDGLTKNLVCTSGKWGPTGKPRVVLNVDGSATVAHEVMTADCHLYIGVEGRNADGTLVIPTVWADCGTIFPGANADADPSVAPAQPVWAQMQAQINELKKNCTSGQSSGMTAEQINALNGMFKVCAFTKADISAEYSAFKSTFGLPDSDDSGDAETGGETVTTYTVTNNLTNVTNSNTQTEVSSTDGYYSATLTVVDGYSMQSVVITMGGVDITADVYGDGGILITEVSGDIVITAVAGVALAYALAEPLAFPGSGNAVYDTGYAMYPNGTKDVSVCIDFDNTSSPWAAIILATANVTDGYKLHHTGNRKWRVHSNAADAETTATMPLENYRMVYIQPKSDAFAIYVLVDDVVTKITGTTFAYYPEASENTVTLGTDNTSFVGAINDFRVYDQILSDGQIEAYLRGGAI